MPLPTNQESRSEMPAISASISHIGLTRELIHAGKSEAGGWNKKQLAAIGIAWSDLRRGGWIDRSIGRVVTREAYEGFIALRGAIKKKTPAATGVKVT